MNSHDDASNTVEALDNAIKRSEKLIKKLSMSAKTKGERVGSQEPDQKLRHYVIELKAWIPHSRVVDPEEPVRLGDYVDTWTDIMNALNYVGVLSLNYEYKSYYRGDNHNGYDGTYRVLSTLEFDWNGTQISGVKAKGSYGKTHRDWNYSVDAAAGIGSVRTRIYTIGTDSGSDSATASSKTWGKGKGNSFSMGLDSKNPVVMTFAPAIDSSLKGTVSANGNLSLSYATDGFPSHGVRVTIDGKEVLKEIVNDASGVAGTGVAGIAAITAGLTSQSNTGSLSVSSPNS